MPAVIDPRTIWCVAENRPSLIARDFAHWGVPRDIVYAILLARGVFKWLTVRRELIRAKDAWRHRITATIEAIREAKAARDERRLYYLRGYLRALEECRGEIRRLCHYPRWCAPDNDPDAVRWLKSTKEVIGCSESTPAN